MAKNQGFIISLEGLEGAGKTTQVNLLAEHFKKAGREVVTVREPGGTKISDQIREVVLSPDNTEMDDRTEVLLFQAARAQLYGEIVLPALKEGKIVLMDRSRDSSLIYQGIVRGMGEKLIERLSDVATHKIVPDLTILLDVSVSVGLGRRYASGKIDRMDMESKDFHQQIRDAYLSVAKKNKGNRWLIVDGEQTIEEIGELLWRRAQKELKK